MMWGGLGGVAAMWYYGRSQSGLRDRTPSDLAVAGKPFLGALLGGAVYLALQIVLLLMGIWLVVFGIADGASEVPVMLFFVMNLLAWGIGFQQDRVLAWLDRAFQRVSTGSTRTRAAPPPL
jgi:hypothetical protein